MNRLTRRDKYGNTTIIALEDVMAKVSALLTFNRVKGLTDVIYRLAAYEDTGLEPEEIAQMAAGPDGYPPCYLAEPDNPYPLCVGRGRPGCKECCLWTDYDCGEDVP